MKIKTLHIRDYKRFHDLTIDLGDNPKRIIALVGPNGCGKSSVFDSMLYLANSHNAIGNTGTKDYHYHSLLGDTGYNYKNVDITFDKGTYYEIRDKQALIGKHNTIFSFRSSFRYSSDLDVREAKAVEEIRLNNYGASTSSSIDQKMEQNYRRLNIKYNKYLNDHDCRPSEAKSQIIEGLNTSIKECLSLKIDNLGDIEAGLGTLFFRKEDFHKTFEFNVLSSGEKAVIDILLDLYLRIDTYNDSIFIIDEPELHLNTSIQRKLLIEIDKMIGANCQIWIATHSIGFLRALQEDYKQDSQIIEFRQEKQWASEKHTLLPMKFSRENWKSIFSTALDDLTNLISPKCIVYCEGRYEPGRDRAEQGFDAKVYNIIFTEKHTETIFVSSGGNTELDQRSEIALAILSKIFVEIEIFVLKDRDVSSGNINDENTRELYLKNNTQNHRILKRFEIENYLFDKEVLKNYCSSNDCVFDENSYDAFVTDINNQNLKDETNRIKNFCGINTSISKEIFKLNLAKYISSDMAVYLELEQIIFERK